MNPPATLACRCTELPYPGKRSLKGGIARKEPTAKDRCFAPKNSAGSPVEERFLRPALRLRGHRSSHRSQSVLQRLAKVAEARYSVGKPRMTLSRLKSRSRFSRIGSSSWNESSLTARWHAFESTSGSKLGRPEARIGASTPPLELRRRERIRRRRCSSHNRRSLTAAVGRADSP